MDTAAVSKPVRRGSFYKVKIIPQRLYFLIAPRKWSPIPAPNKHFFSVDHELVYAKFYNDFGPLNLGQLYRFCHKVNMKLNFPKFSKKRMVHYTNFNPKKRANAAYLMGAYAILYLNQSPEDIYQKLTYGQENVFLSFRDASMCFTCYTISIRDCFSAIYKAKLLNWFDFNDFDIDEYEYFERVENGDLNWIIPGKMLAFCGPHSKAGVKYGYPLHSPGTYVPYFRLRNVSNIVRLNRRIYLSKKFTRFGFKHHDLYFSDGSTPPDVIMHEFLNICETAQGAIAVHCKAGLGRTGTLIGCYLMKHYGFTAKEAIAWLRICRPGSVIGPQQQWLEQKQSMFKQLDYDETRELARQLATSNTTTNMLYSRKDKAWNKVKRVNVEFNNFMDQLRTMSDTTVYGPSDSESLETVETSADESDMMDDDEDDHNANEMSQGDELNRVKANRAKIIDNSAQMSVKTVKTSDFKQEQQQLNKSKLSELSENDEKVQSIDAHLNKTSLNDSDREKRKKGNVSKTPPGRKKKIAEITTISPNVALKKSTSSMTLKKSAPSSIKSSRNKTYCIAKRKCVRNAVKSRPSTNVLLSGNWDTKSLKQLAQACKPFVQTEAINAKVGVASKSSTRLAARKLMVKK